MVTKKSLCLSSVAGELGDSEYSSWSTNHIKTGNGRLWGGRGIPSLSPKVHPQTKRASASWEKADALAQEEQGDRCTFPGLASSW